MRNLKDKQMDIIRVHKSKWKDQTKKDRRLTSRESPHSWQRRHKTLLYDISINMRWGGFLIWEIMNLEISGVYRKDWWFLYDEHTWENFKNKLASVGENLERAARLGRRVLQQKNMEESLGRNRGTTTHWRKHLYQMIFVS